MFQRLKYQFAFLAILFATGVLTGSSFADKEKLQIAAQMENSIQKELLNKWYPQSVDNEYGGFLSTFTYDFQPTGSQDKMIVTQARHVWSNAKAAELYPDKVYYKSSARHGFLFLRDVMWDKIYGGFYTLVDRKGNVKQTSLGIKMAYGNAFGIYGLAAYYQCSGDTAALNLAKKTFMWLEKHSHDPIHKGYYQHLQRDGTPVKRTVSIPSNAETGYKDQNSSIHLLEAFTELYKVWPNELLRERLYEMLLLIRDTITTKQGYLTLFFQPDWTPVSVRDSAKDVILKYHNLDYVSFGHNVETAYLMLEASETLGLKNDTVTLIAGKRMVDHAIRNGWDNKVGGFYDEGFYFKDSNTISIIRDTKNWWAQAEGLNSLLLMSDYFPTDTIQYFQKFKILWNYVQTYLIDHEHGDWYAGGLDKEPELRTALKGQIWKGTYHNFRALANCVERLDPDTIPPSSPENLTGKILGNIIVLQWASVHDNKNLLGYNVYQNNIRIGFTPLTNFSAEKRLEKKKEIYFQVRAIDLHGNESSASKKFYFKNQP
ncbi:MAG TPA: AGE family epimerase/isomerase [Puia sp.]|jgi:mannobiose 2-epimerase|nr:AGE family epimerase/isomerase [Puia sp.]